MVEKPFAILIRNYPLNTNYHYVKQKCYCSRPTNCSYRFGDCRSGGKIKSFWGQTRQDTIPHGLVYGCYSTHTHWTQFWSRETSRIL